MMKKTLVNKAVCSSQLCLRERYTNPFEDVDVPSVQHDDTSSNSVCLSFCNLLSFQRNRGRTSDVDSSRILLETLHNPSDASIDLVFVHGLGGDPVKTWRTKDQAASFWPQDWLPEEKNLANARVHTFGYPSTLKNKDRTALNIEDLGKSLFTQMLQSKTMGGVSIYLNDALGL